MLRTQVLIDTGLRQTTETRNAGRFGLELSPKETISFKNNKLVPLRQQGNVRSMDAFLLSDSQAEPRLSFDV